MIRTGVLLPRIILSLSMLVPVLISALLFLPAGPTQSSAEQAQQYQTVPVATEETVSGSESGDGAVQAGA